MQTVSNPKIVSDLKIISDRKTGRFGDSVRTEAEVRESSVRESSARPTFVAWNELESSTRHLCLIPEEGFAVGCDPNRHGLPTGSERVSDQLALSSQLKKREDWHRRATTRDQQSMLHRSALGWIRSRRLLCPNQRADHYAA